MNRPCRSGRIRWIRQLCYSVAPLLLLALTGCASIPLLNPRATDAPWAPYETEPALSARDVETRSFYITMRDGTKIAVDLHLPENLAEDDQLPTIVHITRYYRSYDVSPPFRWRYAQPNERVRRFLANGYAWVDVDARGSGASFGRRLAPWAPEEVKDYAEIVDWILKQPWSDGEVGAWGRSYDGTAALMLLSQNHPAVKAVVPEFSLFDLYTDVAYPGGLHLSTFTERWGEFNDALDRDAIGEALPGFMTSLALRGVRPVDDDPKKRMLNQAVEEHRYNWDPHETAIRARFRDDFWYYDPALRLKMFSPHGRIEQINNSGAAVYSYAGWFDGAYQRGAIHAHMTLDNPANRLVIGPWNHGGSVNASPPTPRVSRFDRVADQIRFFDAMLKGEENSLTGEPAVHYYTMGEEAWKASDEWPPPSRPRLLYLGELDALTPSAPNGGDQYDEYSVDTSAGTGRLSRWNSVLGGYPVKYEDRVERDQLLLTYTTEPLEEDLEVTGHPFVTLYVSADSTDFGLFAYLEEVTPDGEVRLITEGQLRALHRKLSTEKPLYDSPAPYHTYLRKDASPVKPGQINQFVFDLLPTSYLFKEGHRIRLAIAGADQDHFDVPPGPPPNLKVYRGALQPSHLVLPTIPDEFEHRAGVE